MQGIDEILVLESEGKISSVDHCSYCNNAASSVCFTSALHIECLEQVMC